MKKNKRLRKSVSILELVAIVSVLAISATVGVIVYKNHFKKTVPQTDKELINQLNQSINKNFANVKDIDLTTALDKLEEDGIIFSKLKFSDSNSELVFDSNNNMFGILESGKGVTYPQDIERKEENIDPSLWKFASKNPTDKLNHFSYYLLDGCEGKITALGGIDVGKNDDIDLIVYINQTANKQTAVIKTNSYETELNVSESVGDTINHSGRLGKLTVTRLHTDSYHEYGNLKYAYIPAGRVVAEQGGNIDVAYVTSETAFVQKNGSGVVGKAFASTYRVRNASSANDDKYGSKVKLEYNDELSQEENENLAITAGESALNKAIVEERIERGFENHPNAIGYTKEGDTITIFDSLKEAVSFFDGGRQGIINVTGSEVLKETLVISNQNITLRGDVDNKPVITGNIEVLHNEGNHNVLFENISFVNNSLNLHNIIDNSISEGKDDLNNLEFDNCDFSFNGIASSEVSAIALSPNGDHIGTKLTVKNSTFKSTSNSSVGITTRAIYGKVGSTNRGTAITSLDKPVIQNCKFECGNNNKYPAIITNCIDLHGNEFTGYDTVIKFVPTVYDDSSCQFDVSVTSNTFKNARYLFSLVDADSCYLDTNNFHFDFEGSNSNTFNNIEFVGDFDMSSTCDYIENNFTSWEAKSWSGVKDSSIGVSLDEITMNIDGPALHEVLTLSNGKRIRTFTQVSNDEELGRSGFTLKDEDGVIYYYYATINEEVNLFFKEGTNEAYVSILGTGNVNSLRVKDLDEPVNWLDESLFEDEDKLNNLKYFDIESEDKVGALYKYDKTFTVLNGNTYINSSLEVNDTIIKVSKLDNELSSELYISYIGDYSNLYLTNDPNPVSLGDDTLIISILEYDSNIVLCGEFKADLNGNFANIHVLSKEVVTINSESDISESLVFSSEKAEGSLLYNNAHINSLVLNARVSARNNNAGKIDSVVIGKVIEGNEEEVLSSAKDASLYNRGKINSLSSYASVRITNGNAGYIENLLISYVEGYEQYGRGSSFVNNGDMCTNEGNIVLLIECTLTNNGYIGKEGRTTKGGCIIIGEKDKSHPINGIIISNTRAIFNGLDDELSTRTFIVNGTYTAEEAPIIDLYNDNFIQGIDLLGNYGEDVVYISPDTNVIFNF